MTADFRAAVERKDMAAIAAALHPDVAFSSPVVFAPYHGREATTAVLQAVLSTFEDFRYTDEVADERGAVLRFSARVGDRDFEGVDLIKHGPDGLVSELTVMIRPLSGLQAVAQAVRERLESA